MADDTQQTTETEIHTGADLALEQLTARLDALEAENRELREANKGLWASAHPAPSQEQPIQQPVPSGPSDVDIVYSKLGISKEE